METNFRRFRVITDDPEKEKRLFQLISEKGLSRDDLYLILTGLGLNFDVLPGSDSVDIDTLSKGLYDALRRAYEKRRKKEVPMAGSDIRSRVTLVGVDDALEKVNRYIALLREANALARELAQSEIELNLKMVNSEQPED